jgi:hypothetical protein
VLADVLNPDHLNRVWERMAAANGQAPGLDGVRLGDLSTGERFELFRDQQAAVLDGTFRPQPLREVDIPKADGGIRTLRLAVVADRVLSKAVADALTPLAERLFLNSSYGFRPKMDRFKLLADQKVYCETHDQWTITADDVKKAFDFVPLEKAVSALRRLEHLGADPGLIALAITLITGHEPKEAGIPQGDALSPLTLNLMLHTALDAAMTAARGGHDPVGYLRYADNLVLVTRTAAEGRDALERMRERLAEVGLTLKGAPGVPCDLTGGEHLDLLGLRLTRTGNALTLEIPHTKWDDLQAKLVATHEEANPITIARTLVIGWILAHAPAFGTNNRKDEETAYRLLNLLRATGHRHALTRAQIARTMRTAATRWEKTVAEARTTKTTELTTTPSTTTVMTAHATAATSDIGYEGMDGTIGDTNQCVSAQCHMGETTGIGSAGSPGSSQSPATNTRPSGRSTALPDRPAVPQSAHHRRARTSNAASARSQTHRPRHGSGGRSVQARPPPRPP